MAVQYSGNAVYDKWNVSRVKFGNDGEKCHVKATGPFHVNESVMMLLSNLLLRFEVALYDICTWDSTSFTLPAASRVS